MKWYSIKNHKPPCDGYYIVRFIDNDCDSDDMVFSGCYYEGVAWDYLDEYIPTHFIIPDAIEL